MEGEVKQPKKQLPEAMKKFIFKKGVSGNPNGRPPGPSMKTWAKKYLSQLDDDDRLAFLNSLPPHIVWQMAEGNPENKHDVTLDKKHDYSEEELEAAKQFIIANRLGQDKGHAGGSSGDQTISQ